MSSASSMGSGSAGALTFSISLKYEFLSAADTSLLEASSLSIGVIFSEDKQQK